MSAAPYPKRRKPDLPPRAKPPSRFADLCARFPGPAAFVGRDGKVLAMNDGAGALLASLEQRPGGLAGFVAAAGAFARFDSFEPVAPGAPGIEFALVPLAEGVALLGRPARTAAALTGALAESRARYQDFVEISSDFAWETDAEGRFAFVSPRGALGWSARELVGRDAGEVFAELGAERGEASPFRRSGRLDGLQVWLPRADGEPALVAITAVPLVDDSGTFRGARGVARDLTENHRRDEALAEAEQRARTLAHVARAVRDAEGPAAALDAALLAVVRATGAGGGGIWRRDGEKLEPSAAFGDAPPVGFVPTIATTATEAASAETVAAGVRRLVAPTSFRHRPNGALAVWRAASEPAWTPTEQRLFAALAAQLGLALAQIEGQRELERQARTDGLTGLLNRRSFETELERHSRHARRGLRPAALVYVDLDNFKPVNDRHGHARGDAVLRAVADKLRDTARVGDLVARLGGDEFALWLADTDSHGARAKGAALLAIAGEIGAFSAAPELPLGLSVGVALWSPEDGETVAQLLERADHAMYAAKRGGKGRVSFAPPPEKTKA